MVRLSGSATPPGATAAPAPQRPLAPLTVAAALADGLLGEAVVLAGRRGLDRRVASVGVLDTGELDALRAGQLVLSNARPLRGLELRGLAHRLAAARVSGLGIKLGDSWLTPPEPLVAACEAHGLPLLSLAPGRFEAIVNPVLASIAERQSEHLRRAAELHDALTASALEREPLEAITATLSRVLDAPVAVFDADGAVVAAAGGPARWPAGAACLSAPIRTAGHRYGAVCVGGSLEDEEFARAALVQAAVVCGLQLVGRRRVEAVHRRFERQLLEELAHGSLDAAAARERALRLGWQPGSAYAVLLACARRRPGGRPGPLEARVADACVRALAAADEPARPFRTADGLAIVVHLDGRDPAAAAAAVRRRLAGARGGPGSGGLALGVSRACREVTQLPDALREARLALMAARRAPEDSAPAGFDDLGVTRLVAQARAPSGGLLALAEAALAPLDLERDRDLVSTLDALLAHNLRIAGAAGELSFHYNTVRHRLARLRRLLGARLTAPEDRLALSLALAALRVAEADLSGPSGDRSRSR
jgi:purine catabolism regulator